MSGGLTIAIALIGLQVLSSSDANATGLLSAFTYAAGLVGKWMDPTVPLIADKSGGSSPAAAATTKTTSTQASTQASTPTQLKQTSTHRQGTLGEGR
jgi:hypothetical protein